VHPLQSLGARAAPPLRLGRGRAVRTEHARANPRTLSLSCVFSLASSAFISAAVSRPTIMRAAARTAPRSWGVV